MECYLMSRGRAQALAEALRKLHPKQAKRIDADVVRMFCISSAEAERDPMDPEWLERGPLSVVSAWVDIEALLR
jgi:hypothetical protein